MTPREKLMAALADFSDVSAIVGGRVHEWREASPVELSAVLSAVDEVVAAERGEPVGESIMLTRGHIEILREDCHDTYNGGHRHDGHLDAFHHGMDTVCNVLAEALKAASVSSAWSGDAEMEAAGQLTMPNSTGGDP